MKNTQIHINTQENTHMRHKYPDVQCSNHSTFYCEQNETKVVLEKRLKELLSFQSQNPVCME